MKHTITALVCAAAALVSLSLRAAETSVIEVFACNYNDGKSMQDVEAVSTYYAGQRAKISSKALQKMVSRVWTPQLGSVPFDFIWFNSNLSYREWGEATTAYNESSVGADVQARFDAVATCARSGLYAQDVLFNNLEEKPFQQEPVTIESFLCTLNPGRSLADSDAAIGAWKPVFEKAVATTGASSFVARRTPIISGSGFDIAYLAVWQNPAAYADTNEAFRNNADSARSDELFNVSEHCESALFTSRTLVEAAN